MFIFQIVFWVSFISIFYIIVFYPIVASFLSIFFSKKRVKDDNAEFLPYVSIVMAAYNEEEHIEAKIKNCLSLDYPKDKLEIIIGSDGSDDETNEIAKQYAGNEISFYPHTIRRGKMAVINDAVKNAKGEIIVFSDIYESFDVGAIKKLIHNFVDPSIGAVTGNHISNPSSTVIGKGTLLYWRYQRWIQLTESRLETILSCDGTIYACRRGLFMPSREGTINDDKAVPMGIIKQGYRVVFEPEAIARGDLIHESKAFFNQKVRGQSGMYQIFWLFRGLFLPRKPLLWFIFLSHGVGPVIVSWFALMLLLSNFALYSTYPYNIILILQLLFYFASIVGLISHRLKLQIPLVHLPYFFVISIVASLVGFWGFIFDFQKATWKKVS